MDKDYYKILELEKDATHDEIRISYLKLAKEWHPDLKKTAEAKDKFQDISEAFEILSNERRKEIYDKHGVKGLTASGKRTTTGQLPSRNRGGISSGSGNRLAAQFFRGGIPELDPMTGTPVGANFSQSTGGTTRNFIVQRSRQSVQVPPPKPEPPQKRPVLLALECTLEELFSGCEKEVTWKSYEDGEQLEKSIVIDVEPGWMLGHKIDVEDGNDEVSIFVTETSHNTFKRTKTDLSCAVTVTLKQALCSGRVVIPTIEKGKNLKLTLNSIIHNGYIHEISGYGMPITGTKDRGKLIVTFHVKLPEELTDSQRKEMAEILPDV